MYFRLATFPLLNSHMWLVLAYTSLHLRLEKKEKCHLCPQSHLASNYTVFLSWKVLSHSLFHLIGICLTLKDGLDFRRWGKFQSKGNKWAEVTRKKNKGSIMKLEVKVINLRKCITEAFNSLQTIKVGRYLSDCGEKPKV